MSATLISAAVGGMGFGWFADRFGRVRALTCSMLGLLRCHGAVRLDAHRLAADGLPRPARSRHGRRVGIRRGAGRRDLARAPSRQGARPGAKFLGHRLRAGRCRGCARDAPLRMARGLLRRRRSGACHALVAARPARAGSLAAGASAQGSRSASSFAARSAAAVLVCATMNAATLFAWWGLFTWVPRFLSMPAAEGGRGLSIVATSGWTIVMQMRHVSRLRQLRLHRRPLQPQVHLHRLSARCRRCWCRCFAFVRNPGALLVIGPLVGFFGTGYFSGFSVITSELFPTSLRGTAMGFVYNIGRVASAAAPLSSAASLRRPD